METRHSLDRLGNDELLQRAIGCDSGSVGELCKRYIGPVYEWATVAVRRDAVLVREDAEDIVGDALGDLPPSIKRFEGRGGCSLHTWVERIVRHKTINHHRRRKRELVNVQETPDGGLDELPGDIGPERRVSLQAAIEALPEDEREVLQLRLIEGLSGLEVAELMGQQPPWVSRRLHRAMAKLRRELVDEAD